MDLGVVTREVEGQLAIKQVALEARFPRARPFLAVLVVDVHVGVDELLEVRVDDRSRALVVETTRFEADAPVGIEVQFRGRLVAQRHLGFELLEGRSLVGDRTEGLAGVDRPAGERIGRGRHEARRLATLDVVAQRKACFELLARLVFKAAERGVDVGLELVSQQQRSRVRAVGCVVKLLDHALAGIRTEADAGRTVDVQVVETDLPGERAAGLADQAPFGRNVLLLAHLILRAVAGRRAVGAEGRAVGGGEDEGNRDRADETGLVDREAGVGGGAGEAGVDRCLRSRVHRVDVAGEVSRRAVRDEILIDVRIERPADELQPVLQLLVELGGEVEAVLIVGGADVRVEAELVLVDVLVKRRVHGCKVGQVERGVERQRCAAELGVAGLDVDLGVGTLADHQAAVDRPVFLVGDGLAAVALVLPEAVGLVIGAGEDEAGVLTQRTGDVRCAVEGVLLGIGCAHRASERVGRLDRLEHDGAGCRVAAVDGALRTLEQFDLAQRALALVELCGVGLEDAVDDKGDRAFRVARAVDAANVDLGIARLGGAGHDGDAGGEVGEVRRARRAGVGESRRGDH